MFRSFARISLLPFFLFEDLSIFPIKFHPCSCLLVLVHLLRRTQTVPFSEGMLFFTAFAIVDLSSTLSSPPFFFFPNHYPIMASGSSQFIHSTPPLPLRRSIFFWFFFLSFFCSLLFPLFPHLCSGSLFSFFFLDGRNICGV